MDRNNLPVIQQCLSIAHCVPGTVLGTGPIFSALRRGIRVMGSRALTFICSPKEMDLPVSGPQASAWPLCLGPWLTHLSDNIAWQRHR